MRPGISVSSGTHRARQSETWLSLHDEALLVQKRAFRAPDFHVPIRAVIHGLPAVRAITLRRAGPNRQRHGLPQNVSAIPAMHDDGITRGPDTRIEDQRPGRHRVDCRIASPVAAARRESAAQLHRGQIDGAKGARHRRRLSRFDRSGHRGLGGGRSRRLGGRRRGRGLHGRHGCRRFAR